MRALGYSLVIATLVALVACGGTSYERKTADEVPDGTAVSGTELVERAAEIARAIAADTDQAEAILERHGLTIEQFEKMMYDISIDPDLTSAYRKALQ